jgi:hypothetical protein
MQIVYDNALLLHVTCNMSHVVIAPRNCGNQCKSRLYQKLANSVA